jgi:hypothetical protein
MVRRESLPSHRKLAGIVQVAIAQVAASAWKSKRPFTWETIAPSPNAPAQPSEALRFRSNAQRFSESCRAA